jgi:hypothetical protein
LFTRFGETLNHLNTEARYVLDSFPVAVCHNTRILDAPPAPGIALYYKECPSTGRWLSSYSDIALLIL